MLGFFPFARGIFRGPTAYLFNMTARPTFLMLLLSPFQVVGNATMGDFVPDLKVVLKGVSFTH